MLCSCFTWWWLYFPSHQCAHLWGVWQKGNNSRFTHLHMSKWKINKTKQHHKIKCRLLTQSAAPTCGCNHFPWPTCAHRPQHPLWSSHLESAVWSFDQSNHVWCPDDLKKRNYKLSILLIITSTQSSRGMSAEVHVESMWRRDLFVERVFGQVHGQTHKKCAGALMRPLRERLQ